MKRLYTRTQFENFINLVDKKVPDVLIGTDMMIGFPGESDAAFESSCDLIMNSPLAYAHVFTFSEREGTAATKIQNKIYSKVKKKRSVRMHELSDQKKRKFYQRFVGSKVRVLTEDQNKTGEWQGFSDNYIKVKAAAPQLQPNRLIEVRITGVTNGTAIGNVESIS